MPSRVCSQVVVIGPRGTVAQLVQALEAEELGRAPGTMPFPVDPPSAGEPDLVDGPVLSAIAAGVLEVRYVIEAAGSPARAIRALAADIPELTIVLTEQDRRDHTDLTILRGGREVAALRSHCDGLLVIPARDHLTRQDTILQANEIAMATGELKAFLVLDDVHANGTARHDPGPWTTQALPCADGTVVTIGYPDLETWTAQMLLTNARGLAAHLSAAPAGGFLKELPAVFAKMRPYSLLARDPRQLQDIATLALAWTTGRPVDAWVEDAVARLCAAHAVRHVTESLLGWETSADLDGAVQLLLRTRQRSGRSRFQRRVVDPITGA